MLRTGLICPCPSSIVNASAAPLIVTSTVLARIEPSGAVNVTSVPDTVGPSSASSEVRAILFVEYVLLAAQLVEPSKAVPFVMLFLSSLAVICG